MPLGDPAGYLKPLSPTPAQYGPTSGVYNPENRDYRGPITGTPAAQIPAPFPAAPAMSVQAPVSAPLPQPTPAQPQPRPVQQLQPSAQNQAQLQQWLARIRAMFPNGFPGQGRGPIPQASPAMPRGNVAASLGQPLVRR